MCGVLTASFGMWVFLFMFWVVLVVGCPFWDVCGLGMGDWGGLCFRVCIPVLCACLLVLLGGCVCCSYLWSCVVMALCGSVALQFCRPVVLRVL